MPWGLDLGAHKYIQYHYYSIDIDVDSEYRLQRAKKRLEKARARQLPPDAADKIIDLLLGLASVTRTEDGSSVVTVKGEDYTAPSVRAELAKASLPFRESPLVGKTITEIAKSPTAIAVFVVWISGGNPVAVVVTASGIVAIHIAVKVAPVLSAAVNRNLRKWLK